MLGTSPQSGLFFQSAPTSLHILPHPRPTAAQHPQLHIEPVLGAASRTSNHKLHHHATPRLLYLGRACSISAADPPVAGPSAHGTPEFRLFLRARRAPWLECGSLVHFHLLVAASSGGLATIACSWPVDALAYMPILPPYRRTAGPFWGGDFQSTKPGVSRAFPNFKQTQRAHGSSLYLPEIKF